MPTGTQTANRALRILGVSKPTAGELEDAITAINGFLDEFSMTSVYVNVEEEFNLVAGTTSYTIGDSGDFDTVRPHSIALSYINNGNEDYTLDIIDERLYKGILDKTTQGMPYQLYYEPEYPLGKIYLYFTPDSSDYDLFLISRKPMTAITAAASYDYPQGWYDMICFNAAMRLAPEFGEPLGQSIVIAANNSLNAVIAQNVRNNIQEAPTFSGMVGKTSILNG